MVEVFLLTTTTETFLFFLHACLKFLLEINILKWQLSGLHLMQFDNLSKHSKKGMFFESFGKEWIHYFFSKSLIIFNLQI